MNELRVACEVWSSEVCEFSLTKNLRGKPAKIRLGKVQENLEKDFPWLLHWGFEQRKTVTKQRKLTVCFLIRRFKSTFSLTRRFLSTFSLNRRFLSHFFPSQLLF